MTQSFRHASFHRNKPFIDHETYNLAILEIYFVNVLHYELRLIFDNNLESYIILCFRPLNCRA